MGADGAVALVSTRSAGTVVNLNAYAWDKGQTPGALRSDMPAKISIRFLVGFGKECLSSCRVFYVVDDTEGWEAVLNSIFKNKGKVRKVGEMREKE